MDPLYSFLRIWIICKQGCIYIYLIFYMAICLWGGVTWWLSGKMQEMCVRFLGQEDPLEKEMATHSNILAQEIPWMEEPGGVTKESDTTQ